MNKVFISGPITNEPNFENNFEVRSKALKEMGYAVVNPVIIGKNLKKALHREPKHHEYMKATLTALLDCDGISFLDGSQNSSGSNAERIIAESCGISEVKVKLLSSGW